MAIAADCKSALFEFGGSSPSTPTNKNIMNREEHLIKTFPTKDGKTYIQSLDEFNSKKEGDVKEDTCRSGGINNDADE